MVEIIPAILVKTFDELKARIAQIELACGELVESVDWVQIDIVDGKFAPNETWNNPAELKELKTRLKIEADLMIVDPERSMNDWIVSGVKRIIFHQEAAGRRAHNLIGQIKKAGLETGMSINAATSHEVLYSFVPRLDCVLLLGVDPGFGGQPFQEHVLDKVRALRAKFPELPIEVDGGVNADNARRIVEAGATRLAAGSFIFQHPHGPEAAIQELHLELNQQTGRLAD